MSATYQKNPGWINGLLKRYQSISEKVIAVGFPAGKCQAYPDGEEVAQVAYDNVNGIGCPVRDFMAYADYGIRKSTAPLLSAIAQQTNLGNNNAVDALQEAAGLAGAQAIKSAIIEGDYIPNSPVTIAKKGSSKPLIDTGHLVQTATYAVRNK